MNIAIKSEETFKVFLTKEEFELMKADIISTYVKSVRRGSDLWNFVEENILERMVNVSELSIKSLAHGDFYHFYAVVEIFKPFDETSSSKTE